MSPRAATSSPQQSRTDGASTSASGALRAAGGGAMNRAAAVEQEVAGEPDRLHEVSDGHGD